MTADVLYQPLAASPQSLAILRHPDRRTAWVQLITATLGEPVQGLTARCDQRLEEINRQVPLVGARLRGEAWVSGPAPRAIEVDGDLLDARHLLDPFDLAWGPPIRLLVGRDGRRLALAAHHAAADGRAIVALLEALVGGPIPDPSDDLTGPPPIAAEASGGRLTALRRLLRPADPVPPSPEPPPRDSLAVRTLRSPERVVVAQIASAAIDAIAERSRIMGRPWRRVGLSIPVGSNAPGVGNLATYRRVDLSWPECSGNKVRAAISEAIKSGPMPAELTRAPRLLKLLAPVADRFADSVLISNHGAYELPGVSQLAVFPVARGRSAVVFGAARVLGGESTVTLRARDLTQADAEELLDQTVRRMEGR